jgi:hypothetical protein
MGSMAAAAAASAEDEDGGCERLLPCVELLQGLTVAGGDVDDNNSNSNTDDDVMFDPGLQDLACVDEEANCVDLADVDAACIKAISWDSEGTITPNSSSPEPDSIAVAAGCSSSAGDVLLRSGGSDGSSDMDCMSVVSEGTCMVCGAGEAEVDSAATATADGDQHMMTT